MKETGLMFKAPLVRAILEGRKTQTRRQVTVPRTRDSFVMLDHGNGFWPYQSDDGESALCNDGNEHPYASPFGMPGDRLYVRETWQHANFPLGPYQDGTPVFYRADYLDDPHGADGEKSPEGKYRQWSPAIHMPKAAARIWLEVTCVRLERLQDISEADAKAEGAPLKNSPAAHLTSYRRGFQELLESTGGDWAANPWVWVIDFKTISTTGRPA